MFTQKYVNQIAYEVVGCAIEVHRSSGPGLLESIYELCLFEELKQQALKHSVKLKYLSFTRGKNCHKVFD